MYSSILAPTQPILAITQSFLGLWRFQLQMLIMYITLLTFCCTLSYFSRGNLINHTGFFAHFFRAHSLSCPSFAPCSSHSPFSFIYETLEVQVCPDRLFQSACCVFFFFFSFSFFFFFFFF